MNTKDLETFTFVKHELPKVLEMFEQIRVVLPNSDLQKQFDDLDFSIRALIPTLDLKATQESKLVLTELWENLLEIEKLHCSLEADLQHIPIRESLFERLHCLQNRIADRVGEIETELGQYDAPVNVTDEADISIPNYEMPGDVSGSGPKIVGRWEGEEEPQSPSDPRDEDEGKP